MKFQTNVLELLQARLALVAKWNDLAAARQAGRDLVPELLAHAGELGLTVAALKKRCEREQSKRGKLAEPSASDTQIIERLCDAILRVECAAVEVVHALDGAHSLKVEWQRIGEWHKAVSKDPASARAVGERLRLQWRRGTPHSPRDAA